MTPPLIPPTPLVRWPALLLAICCAALSACASRTPAAAGPPATPLPAHWSAGNTATGTAATLADWWLRFNDPTLSTLVTQALQANTSAKTAQAALLQTRAQRDAQRAVMGLTLGATGSVQRSQTGSADAGSRFQTGFDASWEPDVFGGSRSALDASEANVRASATSLADVQVSLAAEVAVTYIDLRSQQNRLAIARSNLANQTETLQIARWRAQAGLVSALDVEQAVAASEQNAAQIPALQTNVAQALNGLAVLTGRAPGTQSEALQQALASPAAIPQGPPDLALAFPADALRQRPDVRTAEHRISAALAQLNAAEAARYPSFRLSGSLGLSALTLGTLTDGASVLRSLLASVSAPLFDGGAARAQVRAQQAALDQARLAYQGSLIAAVKDVEDALVALQGDRERLLRLQAASAAASQAERLARQRYQSGLIDFRTVLEAQRSLLSAQDSVASTLASQSAALVRLYKALGGGWVPDSATSASR